MDKLDRLENISHYTPPSSPRQTNSLQADTGIRGDGMQGGNITEVWRRAFRVGDLHEQTLWGADKIWRYK